MNKRVLITASAAAVLTATLVSPAGPAQAAAGSCTIAIGPKLAIDSEYEQFNAELREDCAAAGVEGAGWLLQSQRDGQLYTWADFQGVNRTTVGFDSDFPLGGYKVVPDGAGSDGGAVAVPQRTGYVSVKQQSRASLAATRSGRTVTLTATATYYEVGTDRYRPFKGAAVHFQVRTPQGWKTMGRVDAGTDGKASHRQTAGTSTTWRAIVLETTRIWDRTTTTRTI